MNIATTEIALAAKAEFALATSPACVAPAPFIESPKNAVLDKNLRSMTDSKLISCIDLLVREERELLTTVLHHLREVDRRRLYANLQYKSLFDFAVRRLGYAEDQAYRRIAAMKMLVELPELEEKINAGEINLTHLGLANALFNSEKKNHGNEYSAEKKLGVLEQIANRPSREAELITLGLSTSPAEMQPETVKPVTADRVQYKYTVTTSVKKKVDTLKGLLAHQHPNISMEKLMDLLCDLGIQELSKSKEPKRKSAAPKKRRVEVEIKSGPAFNESCSTDCNLSTSKVCGSKPLNKVLKEDAFVGLKEVAEDLDEARLEEKKLSKAALRREVFRRAKNACENCSSQYALEIDHIKPRALGGEDTLKNLRVLCRSCNQRAAIEVFGAKKMQQHLYSH
jgi:hypothetical protein